MTESVELSKEELFVFYVNEGVSKTEAYKRIVDCSSLAKDSVRQLAWRYSLRPEVLQAHTTVDKSLFAMFASDKIAVIQNLKHLALNAESEFVQQSSATAFINATARDAKLEIDVEVKSTELVDALSELREMTLTPNEIPQVDNNAESNTNSNSEKVPLSNLKEPVEVKPITLDGVVVTREIFKEQTEGLNPSYPKGTTGKDISTTGAFRSGESGRFISNAEVEESLDGEG